MVKGDAEGVVAATGSDTRLVRIAALAAKVKRKPSPAFVLALALPFFQEFLALEWLAPSLLAVTFTASVLGVTAVGILAKASARSSVDRTTATAGKPTATARKGTQPG